jgi:hypothetical protein
MNSKIYKNFPEKEIDIGKKAEKSFPTDITNIALVALRRQNIHYSKSYENFSKKIIDLNEYVRKQNLKVITGVVNYWLSTLSNIEK